MTRPARVSLVATLVAGVVVLDVARGAAHKPITSPYTYNEDIFPLLRDRCGSCHVSGGVAPMSLMTHADTVPWGESIRTELLAGQMPPGSVDSAPGRFRNVQGLTPRELNTILTWATGGTPLGDPDKNPAPVTLARAWHLGPPDLTLQMPSAFTVAADAREQTAEFIVPTRTTERRWIRAVDLMPGTPQVVRAAMVSVRSPGTSSDARVPSLERVLAVWLPGDEPMSLNQGAAFELPADADLLVRVVYRKTWEYERKEMTDRSTVGVYFYDVAAPPAVGIQTLSLTTAGAAPDAQDRLAFSRTIDQDVRALAIYPDEGLANAGVRVTARRPDGTRAELIAFHPRPGWVRRYWFREPIPLPRGTRLDTTVTADDETPMLPLSVAPSTATRTDLSAVRLTLNVVAIR